MHWCSATGEGTFYVGECFQTKTQPTMTVKSDVGMFVCECTKPEPFVPHTKWCQNGAWHAITSRIQVKACVQTLDPAVKAITT